jgi:serine phosphatase RsbU (regulator of sigma subunit)
MPRVWRGDLSFLDALPVAAVVVGSDGSIAHANAAALALWGLPRAELLGRDARRVLLADRSGSAHGAGVLDDVLAAVAERGTWTGDLELEVAGGGEEGAEPGPRTRSTTWTAVTDDTRLAAGALLVVDPAGTGTPGLSPSGRRLRRLAAVTEELMRARSVDEVAGIVTGPVRDAAGATVASLALLVDQETLALAGLSGAGPTERAAYASFPLASDNPAAESVRTRELLHLAHEEIAQRYPDMAPISRGTRSMLCLPLLAGGEPVGVVSLSLPGRRRLDDAETVFLRLLADSCAETLVRIRAQHAAADREAKLSLLADVGARLLGSVDYEQTLRAVAEAGLPWFAQWCTVALLEDDRLRFIALAQSRPDRDHELVELIDSYGPQPGDALYGVVESGRTLHVPEISDAQLAGAATDARHLALLRSIGFRSVLCCPLRVGDRVSGVITWVAGDDGRRFDEADLAFAEDLAHRAATAIDSAELHDQVRTAALELQRAVLPDALYDVPGVRTAVEYLPAGRTEAGGDFYDVIYLDDGRIAAFVGDVMGRGVSAASTMAQMRSAIRTLVAVDPTPTAVMSAMDKVFEALHLEQLVTMVYVVVDPALDHLEVINAGHPPPVLLGADGSTTFLDHPSTLILGVGGGERAVRRATFTTGDALLLHTDGLTERRGEDDDSARERLVASLRSGAGVPAGAPELQGWLSGVVEQLRDPTRDDDVAALVLVRDPE